MFNKQKTDVLVVGAGPVGMMTALLLAEQGNKVEIIDGQWRTTSRSYALAVHPRSLKLLDDLGLAGALVEQGYRVDTMAFYEGEQRLGEVSFAKLATPFPYVLVLPQRAMEEALENALEKHKVKIRWSHRLADLDAATGHAEVERLEKESMGYSVSMTGWVVDKVFDFESQYIVGTDGINSTVRRRLDIGFEKLSEPQHFGVFEFASSFDAAHEMRVVLDNSDPENVTTNVLWPLGGGRFRWSFELDASELDTDASGVGLPQRTKSRLAVQVGHHTFPHLDEARLIQLIRQRAPWFHDKVGDVAWSVGVCFEKRLAESFGREKAYLAGDAGHVTSPVGVQSMNVGLAEARSIAQRMTAVLHGKGSAELLDAYNTNQTQEWRQLLGLNGELGYKADAPDWVRRYGERIPALIPASGEDLKMLAGQLQIEL